MTTISTSDIQHLAELSALSLTEEETELLRVDVSSILNYVDKLSELDTENVEPTYVVGDLSNINREDEIDTLGVSSEELLGMSPYTLENQKKVPKVL